MQSLATALRRVDGERRGRATLRLVLVFLLVVAQSIEVSDNPALLVTARLWALPPLCLGALGASLGFAAAHTRATASSREVAGDGLRVALPVYIFAIIATIFALGPALSSEGAANFLRDGRSYVYLLNLVGVPQFELPGMFDFNDVPRVVNAVVWVAPLYLVGLAVACLSPRRTALAIVPALLAGIVILAALIAQGLDADIVATSDVAALMLRGDGLSALLGGLFGIALYHARERVPVGTVLPVGAAAALAGAAVVGNPGWLGSAAFRILLAVPTAYLAIFLTFRRLPLPRLARKAEPYLAGLFLFAYPLQQAVVERGPERQGFLVNLALAGPAALVLASAFWHLVGRRLLSPRARAAAVEAATAGDGPLLDLRRVRRVRRGPLIENLAIVLVLGALFIGVMALLYIALLPEGAM